MRFAHSILIAVIASSFPSTTAWAPRTFPLRYAMRQSVQTQFALKMGPPKEEFLEDCDADPEGECEIDWDKMVFPDNSSNSNDDEEEGASSAATDSQIMEQELYNLVKDGHDAVHERTSKVDPSQARRGLEMAWQMQENQEECEVEKPESCSEECKSCHGTGMVACRFCHGSKMFALQGMTPQPCKICQAQGSEVCHPCRGSGYIADWTQLGLQTSPSSG
ncbi:hypothetical protein MPSEU_000680200 [Mayamaea pseudoterrestris]|nr:hypothetical protein MPSEU_000680200 [Mayamaea pseudoterrestris]